MVFLFFISQDIGSYLNVQLLEQNAAYLMINRGNSSNGVLYITITYYLLYQNSPMHEIRKFSLFYVKSMALNVILLVELFLR